MTPEDIKTTTAEIVSAYLNNQIPLDQSIAEVAKRDKLTDEYIKRLVESANTVTYLKIHERSKDKTFEFPLASFEGVKDYLTAAPIEKAASAIQPSINPLEFFAPPMTKEASKSAPSSDFDSSSSPIPPTPAEALVFLIKEAAKLEKAAEEREVLYRDFHAYAERCRALPEWNVKLASCNAPAKEKASVAKFLQSPPTEPSTFMKEAEMKPFVTLVEKYTTLRDYNSAYHEKRAKLEKLAGLIENIGGSIGSLGAKALKLGVTGAAVGVGGAGLAAKKLGYLDTGFSALGVKQVRGKGPSLADEIYHHPINPSAFDE